MIVLLKSLVQVASASALLFFAAPPSFAQGRGARGQALEGRKCAQILSYYYPGTTVATRVWK